MEKGEPPRQHGGRGGLVRPLRARRGAVGLSTPAIAAAAVVVLAGTSGTILLVRDAGGGSARTGPAAAGPGASPSVPPTAPGSTARASATPSRPVSSPSPTPSGRATPTPAPHGIVSTLPPYAGPTPEALLTGPTPPPAAPDSRVTPDRLSWGLTPPGQQGKRQSVVVVNTGGQPLHVFPAGVTGDNSGDFQIVADSCSGADVAPQGECSVTLVYSPRTAGDARAELLVSDDSGGSPTGAPTKTSSVPLSGTAG